MHLPFIIVSCQRTQEPVPVNGGNGESVLKSHVFRLSYGILRVFPAEPE